MAVDYLLMFRGTDWDTGMEQPQVQEVISQLDHWFQGLVDRGIYKGGQPLHSQGKLVSKQGVFDGPFAESKEAIGGYCIVSVESLDEAVEIASRWPGNQAGMSVEVRPLAEQCPIATRAQMVMAKYS